MIAMERALIAARWDQVARMTRAGHSAGQIAVAVGITDRSVVRIRHRLGISQCGAAEPMTDAERQVAAELLVDGCNYTEVARTLGRCPRTIRRSFPGRGWTKAACGEFAVVVRRMKAVAS